MKGGVASGEGGVWCCAVAEGISNIDGCYFAQSGAGASSLL